MKRVVSLCFAILSASFLAFAQQQPDESLTRNVLVTVDGNEIINLGEYQVELLKTVDFRAETDDPWFSYLYTTTNKYTGYSNIYINGRPIVVSREVSVRIYKIGPTREKSIFVIKNEGPSLQDIGHGMEMVMANGVTHQPCDTVLGLSDDGYIYLLNGKCYHSTYKAVYDNEPVITPMVWLETKTANSNFGRLQPGEIYHQSSEGNFYYLYRDKYMTKTVLVVNDRVVELFDVYDEDDFSLKFSIDGSHWMAVGKECYWVDGQIRSVQGYTITDYVITNDGHFGYKAYKNGQEDDGEVVVVDGQVIRRNAQVCYFALNAEGKLTFRFMSGGRYLQYENDKISDVTSALVSVYYPGQQALSQTVVVQSNNGQHKLTYQTDGGGVYVDDVKKADSTPCYAIFDENSRSFLWNAIERREDRTELVLYKYVVPKTFFGRMKK